MGIKLSHIYEDARDTLEETLEISETITMTKYRKMYSSLCKIIHYHLDEKQFDEDVDNDFANMDLTLTYKERVITEAYGFHELEKTLVLKILSNEGDRLWTHNTIHTIWGDNYPSTVAIDMETGVVYFLYITLGSLELCEFGQLNENEFFAFKEELNEKTPFSIRINNDAMFQYIDGAEGYRHLQENIYIALDCITTIHVTRKMFEGSPF